jgi:hypothetical protein
MRARDQPLSLLRSPLPPTLGRVAFDPWPLVLQLCRHAGIRAALYPGSTGFSTGDRLLCSELQCGCQYLGLFGVQV